MSAFWTSSITLAALPLLVRSHGSHVHTHHSHSHAHSHATFDWERNLIEPEVERCSTPPFTDQDHASSQRALAHFRQRRQQKRSFSLLDDTLIYDNNDNMIITIPTCLHNLYGSYDDPLTDQELQAQLDHLNHAFSNASCWSNNDDCSVHTGIQFELAVFLEDDSNNMNVNINSTVSNVSDAAACITRTEDDRWSRGFDRTDFTRALRRGSWETLNLYLVNNMTLTLGVATFPWIQQQQQNDGLSLDGVVVSTAVELTGPDSNYGEGDTAVHEVGHWLGLPHTFEGGCFDVSDGIVDTPRQSLPNRGATCDTTTDTCPSDPGYDPVTNFMDYSYDYCLFRFTAGQAELMQAVYQYFRIGIVNVPAAPSLVLTLDEPSAVSQVFADNALGFQINVSAVSVAGQSECCVQCTAEAALGHFDIYLSVGEPPVYDDQVDDCRTRASYDGDLPTATCTASLSSSSSRFSQQHDDNNDNNNDHPHSSLQRRLWRPRFKREQSACPSNSCAAVADVVTVYGAIRNIDDISQVDDLVVTCTVEGPF